MKYYKLEGTTPVECSREESVVFRTMENRRVALTVIDDIEVSTVFLSLDHNHFDEGPPILFETMTFGINENDNRYKHGMERRYTTWDEAVEGHNEIVAAIREMRAPPPPPPQDAYAGSRRIIIRKKT